MIVRFLVSTLILLAATSVQAGPPRPFVMDVAGEGRPVYLIPGLASPASVWDELAGHLHENGYQTRVVSLAGFAGQPALEGDEFLPVVRAALADELKAVKGPRPVVIGHSLGGFMALWLGASEPDRVAGIVAIDGVPYLGALGNPSATPEDNAPQAEQMAAFMSSLTAEQYAAQNRMALSSMITDPEEIERIATDGGLSDPATVGRAVAEMLTIDLRNAIAGIQVPVVMIQAADSGATEAGRAAYAAQLKQIDYLRHVVANRGRHFVQIDDPEFVAAEVDRLLGELGHE